MPRQVTLAQAALALGITKEAVRRRLLGGKLEGAQVGGRWYVVLPGDEGDRQPPPTPANPPGGELAALRARIGELESALLELRADRDAWRAALERQQQLTALLTRPAPAEEPRALPDETTTPRTRWEWLRFRWK